MFKNCLMKTFHTVITYLSFVIVFPPQIL